MKEYERIWNILGDDVSKKLDAANWVSADAETEAVKALSDEELHEIVGDLSKEDVEKWYELSRNCIRFRMEAQRELLYRPIFERAKEVMSKPGASGAYCVFHDCDTKDCPDGSHSDL